MLCSYLKGTKLHAWLSWPDCPQAVKECKVLLDQAYGVNGNDTTIIDPLEEYVRPLDTARATNVPPDLGEFVCLCRTVLRAHLRHAGVVFSRSSTNVGNSQIMFYPSGDQSLQAVPGLIKYIFEGDDGSMAFAVQWQEALRRNGEGDPFAAYPHFPAKLYSAQASEKLEKVKILWVVSHYACWAISEEVVVLSLCHVSSCISEPRLRILTSQKD